MAYKLLEMGGKANVILRAGSDCNFNDKVFHKDDIVLLLEDVAIDFGYAEKNYTARQNINTLVNLDIRNINYVNIRNISLSSDYIELFGIKKSDSFYRSVIEEVEIYNNTFYPLKNIDESNATVYCIDNGEKYDVTIDSNNECSITDHTLENNKYTIVYKTKVSEPQYDINSISSIPYLNMEILGTGNIDKQEGNLNIIIPRVSLINRPDFSISDYVSAQDLTFKIIHDEILAGIY